MQEKIGQIINGWHLKASRTIYWQENASAEIAKLFERKVIWEGEAVALLDGYSGEQLTTIESEKGENIRIGLCGWLVERDGQRVRVVVEEIDEAKQDASGDSETVG